MIATKDIFLVVGFGLKIIKSELTLFMTVLLNKFYI